ncbi:glycosyl hydrolase family 43 [Promicromonospora sp. AC04]|uniref:glycoside hydrolase family 43 protein n=1 Tax=Promicromonospora sp. AC04 TaxID=2135723 RepID=UPI000D42256B|nr:glycoside hydrolase family 43 protein [Promicromonospora sp. AC04]PUB24779.1 glycosyl hydrolase family 43 [Promicromonospora sp. AC04]
MTSISTQADLTSVVPIIPGFHPDPSVCRVDDDYYLANSSFEYTPGVPLWHSRDLLTWTLVGNILDRPDQLPPGNASSSGGVYAPTLRHHDGRFWLITTDVSGGGGQIVVSAEDPSGPWTSPTRLKGLHGIDPDLAWDQDGTCYVTYCSVVGPDGPGIAQARVDLESGTVLEEPRPLWSGIGLAHPEAPHLYRRGAYWYLLIAEGGTERGHSVSIARADRPDGPYVGAPTNPVLSHRSTTHPVQNTGHADLVENADGTWAVVYLGVRPRGYTPMFHVNGRETFLAGVDWIDDWPVVDETRYHRPVLDTSYTDAFHATALHPRWVSPGTGLAQIATHVPAGGLQLSPGTGPRADVGALTARVLDLTWRFEADLGLANGSAALLLRLDDTHWCEIRTDAGRVHAVVRIGPLEVPHGTAVPLAGPSLTLRAEALPPTTNGPDDVRLSAVVDGTEHELARFDGRYLSTEVAGGFTGRVVGLRSLDGVVDVAEVRYTPLAEHDAP